MAFEKFIINSTTSADESFFISINYQHIRFSSDFVNQTKIHEEFKVAVEYDNDTYQLRFEFSKIGKDNFFSLTRQKGKTNLQMSATGLYNKLPWFKTIADLKGKESRFVPHKSGTKWVLNLSPSFENAIHKMDLTKLDSNLVGIYRYKKLDTDEIVYIGKGQIKHRFNSPERKDWDFDIIEYSEIKENDSQNKWESYWIEKFKKDFKKLPRYNSIGGKRLKKTK